MNQIKLLLDRVNLTTKATRELFVKVVMDPNEMEGLQRRLVSRAQLDDHLKKWLFVALKVGFFPYTILGVIVNFGLLLSTKQAPSMKALVTATDLFPSPKTRKLLKKMVVEQGVHIETLAAAGRFKTARWIWFSSWLLLIWYGCCGLIMSVAKAIRGRAA